MYRTVQHLFRGQITSVPTFCYDIYARIGMTTGLKTVLMMDIRMTALAWNDRRCKKVNVAASWRIIIRKRKAKTVRDDNEMVIRHCAEDWMVNLDLVVLSCTLCCGWRMRGMDDRERRVGKEPRKRGLCCLLACLLAPAWQGHSNVLSFVPALGHTKYLIT